MAEKEFEFPFTEGKKQIINDYFFYTININIL